MSNDTMRDALLAIMRAADAAKEPCGMDPESPAAIRNGAFATIALMAAQGLGMVSGPALAAPAPQPEPTAWTDADADSARLALELECLLTDQDVPTSTVSRWWESAHEALALHRQRLRVESPAPSAGAPQPSDQALDAMAGKAWDRFEAELNKPATKAERVHALVNDGPYPGMSEAFDAHMGAACWTDRD